MNIPPSPPKQFNSIVGEVYGNVLDTTDNYVYVAKLYMIPPVASPPSSTPTASGTDARTDSGGSGSGGKGGYVNNATIAAPSETVVLAQTGVTGTHIDNIEIAQVLNLSSNTIEIKHVKFEIIQPGAANFLDQILATRAAIGAPVFGNDVPMFLEIVFKGYTSSMGDVDEGGAAPYILAGPFRYRLEIGTISFEITETGSTYSFDCVVTPGTAFTDDMFRMPKTFTTSGGTIDEHINGPDGILRHLRDYQEDNNTTASIKDEFVIDLSGILASSNPEYGLKDLKVDTNMNAEEVNRLMNNDLTGLDAADYKAALEAAVKDEGPIDIFVDSDRITVRQGTTMARYINTLLSMNKEFFQKLTRKVNPEDPSDNAVDRKQAFVNWFKLNGDVEFIDYDTQRNKYARKIYFKPLIYATAKTTVAQRPDENSNLNQEEVAARVSALNIIKAYNYTYTGLNDQIYSCQVKYDAGQELLMPPSGGASGDVGIVNPNLFKSIASINTDLSNNTLAQAAAKASGATQVNAILASLRQTRAGRESIVETANYLGLNDAATKDLLAGRNTAETQAIVSLLSNQSVAAAVATQLEQQKKNTSSDNLTNPDGTAYSPSPSGYIYSADLLATFVSTGGYGAAAEQLRLRTLYAQTAQRPADAIIEAEGGGSTAAGGSSAEFPKTFDGNGKPGDAVSLSLQDAHTVSEVADGTYDPTSVRNVMYGFAMQQHGVKKFMAVLDLEIKGDPWYLGVPDSGQSDPARAGSRYLKSEFPETSVELRGNDQYVLFELMTPGQFDFDTTDEDNNTGYWSQEGVSYFISGVYFVNTVVNNFRDGIFSQDLNLIKQTDLRISVLDRKIMQGPTSGQ
jgi:hypothetical protein